MVVLEELKSHGGAVISLVRPLPEHDLMIGINADNLFVRHKLEDVVFEGSELRNYKYILKLTNIEADEIKRWLELYSSSQPQQEN
ncbi:TPA: hypothetical protein NKA91_003668 [Vibrio parahaemolyticus]|nr:MULTISPECIES: hypothetical protein [Vibrio harveyi group]ARR10341.1 hypothetical protein Vc3S01_p20226 [Vibrio campbellii]MBO0169522.1 hypothetical protein [Vibrio parahaemolyticus]MEA5376620.1 hypothetical protein [Vibrio parahaemolyticus]HCE2033473.1 hypothetical protein [Vibrio parahaemolyticus]HCE2034690.1 hypothetical protein [Vibrio parahaemolyticus]